MSGYRTFRVGPLCGGHDTGLFWVRLYDYGVALKDTRRRRLYYSERNGYSGVRIGPFHVTALRPDPPAKVGVSAEGRVWN